MPLQGTYEPGAWDAAADQVHLYEESGGREGNTMQGKPVVVLWTRGRHSGAVRKSPVMRVRDGDRYAVVASKGGAEKHPDWYLNILADPHVSLQDGPEVKDYVAHAAMADEKTEWWAKATAVYPDYEEYQKKTARLIPVVVLEPVTS
jgi:F420H(2)-dependent quinone reductase